MKHAQNKADRVKKVLGSFVINTNPMNSKTAIILKLFQREPLVDANNVPINCTIVFCSRPLHITNRLYRRAALDIDSVETIRLHFWDSVKEFNRHHISHIYL